MMQGNKKKFAVTVTPVECKGCGRCVPACPRQVLAMSKELNLHGQRYAEPVKDECVGCGACFYSCPEPGAITVFELDGEGRPRVAGKAGGA